MTNWNHVYIDAFGGLFGAGFDVKRCHRTLRLKNPGIASILRKRAIPTVASSGISWSWSRTLPKQTAGIRLNWHWWSMGCAVSTRKSGLSRVSFFVNDFSLDQFFGPIQIQVKYGKVQGSILGPMSSLASLRCPLDLSSNHSCGLIGAPCILFSKWQPQAQDSAVHAFCTLSDSHLWTALQDSTSYLWKGFRFSICQIDIFLYSFRSSVL